MSLILNQLEFGHIFIGDHIKTNHQQLIYMLGLIVITNISQIVIQVAKLFVIKKASQFGDKVHK